MRTLLHSMCFCAAMALNLSAAMAQQISNEAGLKAVRTFVEAVAKGDPDELDIVLAPEFQIVRANGVMMEKEEYLAGFPASHSISGDFSVSNLQATGAGDVMVVGYALEITEAIEGAAVTGFAPRLSTFRYIDGDWRVTAHANFGAVEPPK